MGVFETEGSDAAGHEQVVFCQDRHTGLKAIISIYSTALGPALGGTRFYPYATEEQAVTDALHLSRAMAYKNAPAEERGTAAGVRPVRAVVERPLLHRLRRRHVRRGHGRHRP
jgi:valine dehydrogenase (NAD+)